MDSKQPRPASECDSDGSGRASRQAGDRTSPDAGGTSADSALSIVYDALQVCPYRDGQIARMPLEYPSRRLVPRDLDRLLAQGYRRTGAMFYRTHCPACRECIPVRVDVNEFEMTRSMRRILNRAERELVIRWGAPEIDEQRLQLFNDHRAQRQLSRNGPADLSDYHEFLVATCVDTAEIAFFQGTRLVGVSIVDRGEQSVNAVYTHFDPTAGRFSIGTLSVLHQIQWARQAGKRFVYLGLFVAENAHLNYKARFRPQQRLIAGLWQKPAAN